MKRTDILRSSALSLALIIAFQLMACGSSGSDADTTDKSPDSTEPVETTDARLAVSDGLPDVKYDGYDFRIATTYYGKNPAISLYAPEEASGDVVDDAFYARNQRVSERFDINIVEIDSGMTTWEEHTNFIKKSIMAGDDDFDIAMNHIIGGPNLTLEGAFLNLYDIDHMDFSKPWWSEQMIDEMTVRDQLYLVGDIIGLGALKSAKVLYINKGAFADRKLDLPYDDVFAGTWTMDKLFSLTKDIYEDTNGDAQRDVNDFYGYVSHASQNGWLVSCDVPVLEKDPDKTLKIVVNGEKVASLVEQLYRFYFESDGTLIIKGNDPVTGAAQSDWQAQIFADGHALVGFALIKHASSILRESDVEYGIIPFPKWDDNQETYRTFCGGDLLGIPTTAPDPDRTGVILEALAAETWKTAVPAYFDTALKEKFTYDSESGQTLDIINDTLTISFAYAYDNWQGFGHMLGSIFASSTPSPDYASFYAGRINSAEERLKLITDFFEKNAK